MLIDDAKQAHDPHTVLRLHTAHPELDPFAEETIKLAHPALDIFMNCKEVLAMAQDAKRMPARARPRTLSRQTCWTCSSVNTQTTTTSASEPTSARSVTGCAPSSLTPRRFSTDLPRARTSWPASTRRRTMGAPMRPAPTNPTRVNAGTPSTSTLRRLRRTQRPRVLTHWPRGSLRGGRPSAAAHRRSARGPPRFPRRPRCCRAPC